MRDSLHASIIARLPRCSDGNLFEACVCDLLRAEFSRLVPVEGGNDAGVDGMIAEDEGPPTILVSTIERNVIGNFSQSVRQYLKSGGSSKRFLLATTQQLSPVRKRNLAKRATELGVSLLPIYDRPAIANLLYHNPRCRKELLNLSGDPPALSVRPMTNRPTFGCPLLGRDEDIQTIAKATGDLVIVGQPGAGKTSLLAATVEHSAALFVVDDRLDRIAEEIREKRPQVLMIDDAHTRVALLSRLRHLRSEIDAEFRIVASCWPGQQDAVAQELGVGKNHVHELELLVPNLIRDVIQASGIYGPRHLLQELIAQAAGKPGLAVTLCRVCLNESTREVFLGTALARDVRLTVQSLIGLDALSVLACFAIGGSGGMSLHDVATYAQKSAFDVQRIAEQLGFGGVIEVVGNDRLRVVPARLGQALVRDIFFNRGFGRDVAPLLSVVPNRHNATLTLVAAKMLGGEVPDALLRSSLLASPDGDTLNEYASLGGTEANWVLDTFPEKLREVAAGALESDPKRALHLLLDDATKVPWVGTRHTGERLPQITTWVRREHADTMERRSILCEQLLSWFAQTKNIDVAAAAVEIVLSLEHKDSYPEPGEPNKIILNFGVLPERALEGLFKLWPKALAVLSQAEAHHGMLVANIFHSWIHPSFHAPKIPASYERNSRRFARQMMCELIEALGSNWTILHHLKHYATELRVGNRIKSPPVNAILFPNRESENWKAAEARQLKDAQGLAKRWLTADPVEVASQVAVIETEAIAAEITYPRLAPVVMRFIAERTSTPAAWLDVLWHGQTQADLLEPFLARMIRENRATGEQHLLSALDDERLRRVGLELALMYFGPSQNR
jgi:hypothetical protein